MYLYACLIVYLSILSSNQADTISAVIAESRLDLSVTRPPDLALRLISPQKQNSMLMQL